MLTFSKIAGQEYKGRKKSNTISHLGERPRKVGIVNWCYQAYTSVAKLQLKCFCFRPPGLTGGTNLGLLARFYNGEA